MINIMRLLPRTLQNRIDLFNKKFSIDGSTSIIRNFCSNSAKNTVDAVLSNGYTASEVMF